MATQADLERACAEADEKAQRRAAARERMIAQMGHGQMIPSRSTSTSTVFEIPKCPWCGELFDAAFWGLDPALEGQVPIFDVLLRGMDTKGDHEATCPTCGFVAHFRPKEEG